MSTRSLSSVQRTRTLPCWSASRGRWLPVAALCLVLLSGCDLREAAEPGDTLSHVGSHGEEVTVGPVPGPPRDTPQPTNPIQLDARTRQQGRQLFMAFNCGGCHGDYGGGGMGPSLRDARWLYGRSDAQIYDSIASGRAHGMPAWGTMLPQSEIWKLTAYIQSLRTDDEPQRPPR